MGKKYEPKNNFKLAEDLPYSGSKLDAEFGAVSDSTDKIEKFIKRSDFDETTGKLKAGVVAHHNVDDNLWQFLLDSARGESEQNRIDAQSAAVSADKSAGEAAKYAKSAETAREGIEGSAARAEDAADAAELALQGSVEAQAESISSSVDADNAANHAEGSANAAWLSEKQAADWAEYLAGPVPLVDGSYLPNDAPESVQSGYFSSRWWAAEAERIVGEGGSWWLGNHAGPPVVEPPPQDGSIYWDLITLSFWIYVDGGWHEVGRANATLSDVPPKNPKEGDIWIDSGTTAEEFIWTGYEWISMTGGVRVSDDYDVPPDGDALYGAVQGDGGLLEWTPVLTSNVGTDPGQRGELESRSRVEPRAALTHQKPVNLYLQDEILDVDRRVTALEEMPAPEADTDQIEADLSALEKRVESNESGISVNADGVSKNASDLSDEVAARKQGDIDLGIRIDNIQSHGYDDSELKQLIASETSTRESEDRALAGQIEKESADRVAGDKALGERIDAEAAARAKADSEITGALSAESKARAEADDELRSAIEGIDIPETDLSGLATEEYVDEAIAGIEVKTDDVKTNPDVVMRDAKGRFRSTEDYSGLTNQLEVNRFIANELDALNEAIENIDIPEGADLSGYATKEELDASTSASAERDAQIIKHIDEVQEESNQHDAIHELSMLRETEQRKEADEDLQKQIDELAAGDVDLSPVEDRLDKIEEVLPKAPIVIPPVDLGRENLLIDYPDRPTGTNSPPTGECWMWHMDAGREASGNIPANEMKVTVARECVDNILIDGTEAVWFKQGDRVQKWNVQNGGWWTASNLWHMSAKSTEGDDLVNGQPYEVYYIDPNATGDDLIDAISRIESKADDRKLQAEIEVLSGQLSTLVKSQEDGEWKFVGSINFNVPRNAGEFALLTSELTSETNGVVLREEDLNGITHNFNAPVGSYIEIVDIEDPMDYVLFEVTKEPDGTGLVQIDCKMVKAGNPFDLDDRCIIRFFEVSDGLDINELDSRYLKLAGGTMRGNLRFKGEGLHLGYIDDNNQNWIQFSFGQTTEYKGFYSSDDAIATKKRITEAVEGLASESWVTEQIEAIEIPDLSGEYATEEYVNQKVYQEKFLPGQQVAKTDGSSSNITGAFWIVDGALYCKV